MIGLTLVAAIAAYQLLTGASTEMTRSSLPYYLIVGAVFSFYEAYLKAKLKTDERL